MAAELTRTGRALVETGSPYAVGPGLVLRRDTGVPYQVFTPWSRAWRDHGWPAPAAMPKTGGLRFGRREDSAGVPEILEKALRDNPIPLPEAGEAAALARWREFLEGDLAGYDSARDRPDLDGTTVLSPHLTLGVVHPRTLLADVARRSDNGAQRLVTELSWREFYADVLWHHPHSAWLVDDGLSRGYPARIVDHVKERRVALDRLRRARRTM